MFYEKYKDKEKLKQSVKGNFSVVRPLSDRDYWENIRLAAYEQVQRYINEIGAFDFALPASMYLDFVRNGNRTRYEGVYFERRKALTAYALSEAMENKGNYLDKVLDFVWMILEETTWCLPAHCYLRPESDGLPNSNYPVLDLFQAETGATLSFVLTLFQEKFEQISKNIVPRIKHEIQFRVIDNFLNNDDYWWLGFSEQRNEHGVRFKVNNWNPWILSNTLLCSAAVLKPGETLCDVVEKVMKALDNYADAYPSDGACDEGPSYWGKAGLSLLDCAYFLNRITGGYINEFDNEKIINTAEYITKVYIGNGYYVNFADCPPRISATYGTICQYGKLLGSEPMIAFAKESFSHAQQNAFSLWEMPRGLVKYETMQMLKQTEIPTRFFRDVYFSGTEVAVCREADSAEGLFFAAKGGHNDESHNHNDIGNFIVYKDGEPFIIDPGNETYCAKTFSERRYEIWNNQSCFHNTPTIDGKDQSAGFDFRAANVSYEQEDDKTSFSLDIKNAYENRNEIKKWQRTVTLWRDKKEITVTEDFALNAPTNQIILNLMTVCDAAITSDALILTAESGKTLTIAFDTSAFDITCEAVNTTDSKMLSDWGKAPAVIRLQYKAKTDSGSLRFTIK